MSSSVTSSPFQNLPVTSLSPVLGSPYPWLNELKSEDRCLYLIHLLLTCANHVAAGSLENANLSLDQISYLASPDGDTMQRIASYFTEALAHRILKGWPGIYKALHSTKISSFAEDMHVRKIFLELFPFIKVAFVITNQAIIEAMEGEKMVHIIDLYTAESMQWHTLLQDFSARPEGPPHLRITGVHPQKEVLDQMAHVLTEEEEKLDIPFQFNPIVSKVETLDIEKLRVKTGEALPICSVLQLHSLLSPVDEPHKISSSTPMNPNVVQDVHRVSQMRQSTLGDLLQKDMVNRLSPSADTASSSPQSTTPAVQIDGFLSALWGLSPKVMVVAEQDSNHNGSNLMERLSESLYFYAALFDCLESTLPRTSVERLKLEKFLFGKGIKNIIACEGAARKERHEKLAKWIQRLDCAGFGNVPLSYYGMLQARRLLQGYRCDGYRIKEENGCVIICWQDRALFSVSAWRCKSVVNGSMRRRSDPHPSAV